MKQLTREDLVVLLIVLVIAALGTVAGLLVGWAAFA